MTSRKICPGAVGPGRATRQLLQNTVEEQSGGIKLGFDGTLSLKIDCVVFLIENEPDVKWRATLRSYWRRLEEEVSHVR